MKPDENPPRQQYEDLRAEEIKRTSRILELIQIITAAPRRYLRRDLAERFEVSERMLQKDLDIIRHGLKLHLAHSQTGYYFEEVPQLPALQYSFPEALALLLAIQAARQVSGIGSSDLAAAVARLEALFPEEFTPLLQEATKNPLRSAQREHRQEVLNLLSQALLQKRKVCIVYETRSRRGEVSERTIHPYHLMPYVRSWQLVAFCERRKEVLMFKVDRIQQVSLLEDGYNIPADFDIAGYMGQAWGIMRGAAGEVEEVALHFSGEAGRRVAEETWHSSQVVEDLPDGSLIFRVKLAVTPEFVSWVLYYGDQVRVEQPEWLRQVVREAHRRAVEANAEQGKRSV